MSDLDNMGPNRVWYRLDDPNTRFFDVSSMHTLPELFGISELLMTHQPERIVEYGAAWGGLSKLLGRWAYVYGATVLSIENHGYTRNDDFERSFELLKGLPVEYLEMNEYDQKCFEKVQDFAKDHRTFFYCDGGNKPLEARMCAQILKPGDLLVCHDYYLEEKAPIEVQLPHVLASVAYILPKQLDRIIKTFDLERLYEEHLGEVSDAGKRLTRLVALQRRKLDDDSSS